MSRPGAVAALPSGAGQAVRLRITAAAASGLLLAGAFPPLDAGILAWVALVPLLWAIHGESPSGAFRLGLLTGFLWFSLTLSWVTLFGLPAWVLLSTILSLYIGGFAALFRWLTRRFRGREVVLIPLVWTAVEVMRSSGPLGFPWGVLGVSQHAALAVLQVAAVGGAHLISLVVALGNALLFSMIIGPRRSIARAASVLVLLAAAVVAFGFWRLQTPLGPGGRMAVIQPNIPPQSKSDLQTYQEQMSALRRLTDDAVRAGAALIVFPETAVPANLLGEGGNAREVARWAPDRVVVASSQEVDERGIRNFAAVLSRGQVLGTYAKRRLVPFGEAGIAPGDRAAPIVTPVGSIGLLICYESAFGEFARQAAQEGAAVLAVLTNDGWFGRSAGPVQHAAYAPVRAVETGRTVVRAANTGISMVIDPHGRVLTRLPLGSEGASAAASARPIETVYLRGGWVVAPGIVLVVVLLTVSGGAGMLRGWWTEPGFSRVAGTLLWPGLIAWLTPDALRLFPRGGSWLMPAAVLAAVWITAGGWRGLALRPRLAPVSALVGLAVVAVLGAAMAAAYRRYGFAISLPTPPGGWMVRGALLLFAALAQELWLRGAVFTAAEAWRGRWVAVVISTLPVLGARGLSPETLIWSLFTGALFGGIRALTGDALGLVLPRAVGTVLLMTLDALRQ